MSAAPHVHGPARPGRVPVAVLKTILVPGGTQLNPGETLYADVAGGTSVVLPWALPADARRVLDLALERGVATVRPGATVGAVRAALRQMRAVGAPQDPTARAVLDIHGMVNIQGARLLQRGDVVTVFLGSDADPVAARELAPRFGAQLRRFIDAGAVRVGASEGPPA